MTLLDIVGEPLLVHGMTNRQERQDRVAELLKLVGLRPEYMRRFPHASAAVSASASHRSRAGTQPRAWSWPMNRSRRSMFPCRRRFLI